MQGRHVVEELVGAIRQTLRPLLPPPGGAALLDFPAHTNAGDSLLYLGQQRILRGLGHRLAYVADTRTYSAAGLRARAPAGPIFLQGGGDLADRWLGAPSFYQQVFRDFPERAIVQLPLSTAAKDGQRETLAGLARASRNLLLLVRDQPSLDRARATFPEVRVEYAPDLAVGWGVLRRPAPPDLDVVLLLRDDSSRYDAVADLPREVRWIRTDWGLDGPARRGCGGSWAWLRPRWRDGCRRSAPPCNPWSSGRSRASLSSTCEPRRRSCHGVDS